jgi:hypothetical protein
VTTYGLSTFLEIVVYARAAVRPTTAPVRISYLLYEYTVLLLPLRYRALLPGVIAAGGKLELPAHERNWKIGLLRTNHFERSDSSLAK